MQQDGGFDGNLAHGVGRGREYVPDGSPYTRWGRSIGHLRPSHRISGANAAET